MKKVIFQPENIQIICNEGDNLLEVARKADVYIEAPCNGNVSCGKCKVKLLKGNIRSVDDRVRTAFKLEKDYISSCHSEVVEDIVVEIPRVFASSLRDMKIDDLSSKNDIKLFNISKNYLIDNDMKFTSYVRKDFLQIPRPDLSDNISDWDRIKRYLKVNLGYKSTFCRLPTLKKLPQLLRDADFNLTITHIPRGENRTTIINLEPGDSTDRLYGVAVDVGTTSVAAFLVDIHKGELLARASAGNAQLKYGADVISRTIIAGKEEGLDQLNHAIIKGTINPILDKMFADAGVDPSEVIAFVAAGNTIMTHLLLGVFPGFLRKEPYVPGFIRAPFVKASELGIAVNPETFLYMVPSVSSYVGGDITSGILASGIWSSDKDALFIDLGTNGEIVFGNKEYLLACACSAGPAFEGGGMSCGMRASYGAIEKVEIEKTTFDPKLTIIGGGRPLGICGSGFIDLIAEMMINNIINQKGKFNRNLKCGRVRFDEHGTGEYVIVFKEAFHMEADLSITEVDIDSFIRTKAAIYSGAATLLGSIGKDFDSLEKVYIAGGIGNNLNIENSIRIGLLPDISRNNFFYIGNSSLMGCYLTLMSEDARRIVERVSGMITNIELSVFADYMDTFISACFLPHTDINQFPSVKDDFKRNLKVTSALDESALTHFADAPRVSVP